MILFECILKKHKLQCFVLVILVEIQNKNRVKSITLLFTLVYTISYITRINYGAIIAEMEAATSISRELLSMALTGSFITYGVGQIISGIIGDHFSPKKLVSMGLVVTILMNLLIPISLNPYLTLVIWCINGFAQSFMWPPIVKLMSALLSENDYKKTTVMVSCGSSFGTIAVYLVAPLIISILSFRWVFVFSALCGTLMLVSWHKFAPDIEIAKPEKAEKTKSNIKVLFTPLMLTVMFVIILQGALRDGITTWMPTYISDTYSLSSVISILTGVVLPLFSICCMKITEKLYIKYFKNPIFCAAIIFGVGAVSAAALCLVTGRNAIFSVLFSAILTAAMFGVNLLYIGMLPAFFKKYGNVSTASGVLNSTTYIGSAISSYGIAVISKDFGWNTTLLVWLAIAVLGTAMSFLITKPWAKFAAK